MRSVIYMLFFMLNCTLLQAQTTDEITNLSRPTGIHFEGSELYIIETAGGRISKINTTDTNPIATEIVSFGSDAFGIDLRGSELYFTYNFHNTIAKIDISQSNPSIEDIASIGTNLAGDKVLLIEDELFLARSNTGTDWMLSKMDITSSNPIFEDVITNLDVSSSGMRVYNDVLYFAEQFNNRVMRLDLTDPNPVPELYRDNLQGPFALELQDSYLYVGERDLNRVVRFNLDDLNEEMEVVVNTEFSPRSLAILNDELYIAETLGDKITKVDIPILSTIDYSNNDIQLTPNPTNDFVQVHSTIIHSQFKIYNLTGVLVAKGRLNVHSEIQLEQLDSGIYFIELDDEWVFKILKN